MKTQYSQPDCTPSIRCRGWNERAQGETLHAHEGMKPRFEINEHGDVVSVYLANGERIILQFNDALNVTGYELLVLAPQQILMRPRSGNALTITTPRALVEQEKAVDAVVVARKREQGS